MADLDDQIKAAIVEHDLDEMARLLKAVNEAKQALSILDRYLQGAIYDTMEAKHRLVGGVGALERQRPGKTARTDSEALLSRLLTRAVVDPESGEMLVDTATVARIENALSKALPITASLGWRHGGLDELGVEWRDLHTTEPGPKSVRLL